MTADQLTQLRSAEDTALSAQERLAKLESITREIFAAMVLAGNARAAELLGPEDMNLFGFEVLSETVMNAARLAMDDLVIAASDDARAASDFVHDLQCEQFDAAHPDLVMITLAEAAE